MKEEIGGAIIAIIICCLFGIQDYNGIRNITKKPIAVNTVRTEQNKKNKKNKKTETEKTETEKTNIQNIFIVGRTGSGKSTLANVLSNEAKFAEMPGFTSGTKRMESKDFEWCGNHYRIIDTVGTEDISNLSSGEITSTVWELLNYLKNGETTQVFFVIKDRFTKEQVAAFELFKKSLLKCTTSCFTIICSNFPGFQDKEKCTKDIKRLKDENESIAEVIGSCKIIHVDNPPLEYGPIATERRMASREILLNYLESTHKFVLDLSYSAENIDAEEIFKEVKNNIPT